MTSLERLVAYGRMIRFSHSIFALPFALASMVLALEGRSFEWRSLLLILVAMVGARSAAMGFNRLADHSIDARNPRTAGRELPQGRMSRAEVWLFVVLSSVALVVSAGLLNPLCLALSPVALGIVLGYSFTKRFTLLSHAVLGLGLAIGPVGAWIAIRGTFDLVPILLAMAVLGWVAGFDIIYACQDIDFDRAEGLHSVPARLGIAPALIVSRVLHLATAALLASIYPLAGLHPAYLMGVLLISALLVYEHSLVRPTDLSRVNAAFFTMNGWVSVLYLASVVCGRLLA